MDVFDLRRRIVDDYSAYVRSFASIRDERIANLVDQHLAKGALWPDPLIQLSPATRDDASYILDTFPIVRRHDEAAHGEYRTKRVILESYDRMSAAIVGGPPFDTILDPPPADPRAAHGESTHSPELINVRHMQSGAGHPPSDHRN